MATFQTEKVKIASEKAALACIKAAVHAQLWTLFSGSVYSKSVDQFVVGVKEDDTDLTQGSSTSLSAGEWYFDPATKTLYVHTSGSDTPDNYFTTVRYQLFFSTVPLHLPYDLTPGSFEVPFVPNISQVSSFKQEIDSAEQFGIALEGSGTISFFNNDGFWDEIYDTYIWENQEICIYYYFPNTPVSEARLAFKGKVQDKTYSPDKVSLKCKDFIFDLRKEVNLGLFSASDGILADSDLDKPKKRLYGRVQGVRLVGTDRVLSGFSGTGTLTGTTGSATVTVNSGDALDELSPEDKVITTDIFGDTVELTVKSVDSDTQFTASQDLDSDISTAAYTVSPEIPYRKKNRTQYIAGHKLRAPNTTITTVISQNRIEVNDVTDFFAGDPVKVNGEDAVIRRISGNEIVLEANLAATPSVSDLVTREPVLRVYQVEPDLNKTFEFLVTSDYTLTNTSTDCYLTFTDVAEFNQAPILEFDFSVDFNNASRTIDNASVDLNQFLKPRDWIRGDDITHQVWYEVLQVAEDGTSAELRVGYTGGNDTATTVSIKRPVTFSDKTIIAVDCYGKENAAGEWVNTASRAVKDLVQNDAGITDIDTASFNEAHTDGPQLLSFTIPKVGATKPPIIRKSIALINRSVFGSLYNTDTFDIAYNVLDSEKPSTGEVINDSDVIKWDVRSKTDVIKTARVTYREFEVDFNTGEKGFKVAEQSSSFVSRTSLIDTDRDFEAFLYEDADALTIAQRLAFFYSLSQSIVNIQTDLRYADSNLNDKFWIEFDRLYKRYGLNTRQKIGIINKIDRGETTTNISFTDLGNWFNRVANVADNAAASFSSAPNSEKMLNGYVVDNALALPDTSSDVEKDGNLVG